jgi:hypothetical protein
MTRQETLSAVRLAAREAASAGELPSFLAELELVRVEAVLAAAAPREAPTCEPTPPRILTASEAGKRLGRSRWWIYRHKAALPVTRFPTGGIGFDNTKLERWIEGRTR